MSETPEKYPVHVLLPLELSGRGNHVDRLWYAIEVLKVRDFTLEADFQPFTLKRESTTDMPWGAVQSVKRWHLEVETLDVAQRQVTMKPYRVARSKSDHLLETLEACGWKRAWELERSTP